MVIADGMQADAIAGDHCSTPHLSRLAERGVTFANAHTTCPTCSPARASLMTGLLPHNHGVLEVEHGRDPDQSNLRTQHPHFAQRLSENGYDTAYFGKWHIERSQEVERFGWQTGIVKGAEHLKGLGRGDRGPGKEALLSKLSGHIDGPPGYKRILHWGVTQTPLNDRYPGLTMIDAENYLQEKNQSSDPWCCCVSFSEPNEALIVGESTWNQYQNEEIPLPENFFDEMSNRPQFYQRQQKIGQQLSEAHWKNARRCYYGRITELDSLVGHLISLLEQRSLLEETYILFLADHGRYVGAHGFDAHNFGAFEEIFRIPLVIAGPATAENEVCQSYVSIADLAPTICEMTRSKPIFNADSHSFSELLQHPSLQLSQFETGYAENHGTRFSQTQRILWQDQWKFVFNGFDFDELYNLEEDPYEKVNLINALEHQKRADSMMQKIWKHVRETGDRAILESHYFSMRFARVGPEY